jgi:hypothetical protein
MPSLPAMVYLEKEIKQMNGEIDEFLYSAEYIDNLFDAGENDYSHKRCNEGPTKKTNQDCLKQFNS